MAFTDNCDLFASVHERGVNRVINHFMRQRPSLFNYATIDIALNRELWCAPIEFTSDVPKYGNPLFTIMDPLPILGADSPPVSIGFIVQIPKIEIDLHPGNVISLPPELGPPLKKQQFALRLKVCGSLACPSQKDIDGIPIPPKNSRKENRQTPPPVVLRGQLQCFCLEVFAIGHFERGFIGGKESLLGKIDGLEIVDIKPEGLENNIECYLKTMISVLLRQKLTIALETLTLSFPLFNLATVTVFPTPNPPIPNNPAVEDDQLKVFISMTVI
jgi:hypothetical protein